MDDNLYLKLSCIYTTKWTFHSLDREKTWFIFFFIVQKVRKIFFILFKKKKHICYPILPQHGNALKWAEGISGPKINILHGTVKIRNTLCGFTHLATTQGFKGVFQGDIQLAADQQVHLPKFTAIQYRKQKWAEMVVPPQKEIESTQYLIPSKHTFCATTENKQEWPCDCVITVSEW